jgi:hypothetical protein
MNEHNFDDLARRAGEAVSRRATLATLGTVGLAALAHPFPTAAKKGNKKNTTSKKATKRCKKDLAACTAQGASCSAQAEDCRSFISASCTSDPSCPGMIACCTFFESCDAGAFLTCLENAGAS